MRTQDKNENKDENENRKEDGDHNEDEDENIRAIRVIDIRRAKPSCFKSFRE